MTVDVTGCDDCKRLWDEYRTATHHQFQLESKLQIAGYSRDHDSIKLIAPLVDEAARMRSSLREKILSHGNTRHSHDSDRQEVSHKTAHG